MLAEWIDFSGIASVAKRAKRTALLFSRLRAVELPDRLRRWAGTGRGVNERTNVTVGSSKD